MYGSRLVLVPTTLVAMADACVGGVTTIDFKSTRNRVGIIHPAEKVIICTDTLKSLSKTDFMNGLSVIIKHSFLSDDDSLGKTLILEKQKVTAQEEKVLQNIISLSLRVKANFTEPAKRPFLELGEALACDLQLLYPSRFSYGKALAWGMCRSAEIAIDTGKCTPQYGQSIIRMYQSYGFDTQFRIPRTQWQEMRSVINRDRSYSDRNYRFVLPVNQGKTEITEIDEDTIRKAVIENVVF
jgi:3-dehydroquinate synthase